MSSDKISPAVFCSSTELTNFSPALGYKVLALSATFDVQILRHVLEGGT
jgi:hypothetical protein